MDRITIMNPQVAESIATVAGAARPQALKDIVLGFVDNSKLNADKFIATLQPILEDEYGAKVGVTVRKLAPKDELSLRELAELAKCNAVVQCYGD
jgi:hypothetical protein